MEHGPLIDHHPILMFVWLMVIMDGWWVTFQFVGGYEETSGKSLCFWLSDLLRENVIFYNLH